MRARFRSWLIGIIAEALVEARRLDAERGAQGLRDLRVSTQRLADEVHALRQKRVDRTGQAIDSQVRKATRRHA